MSARGLLTLAAIETAALWLLGWWGGTTPFPALACFALAFAAYVIAARGANGLSHRQIWACGIGMRLGLVPLAPALSEDVYRYMWDGRVQLAGRNPYDFAPGASEVASLRTEWWSLINHVDVPTIYPPGAQLAFLLLAWIGPTWLVFKLAWLVADLTVAWALGRWSSRGDRTPLLLYLWSPLLIVEVAWSAHLEPLGIAPMIAALALISSRTRNHAGHVGPSAGALLGLGASVKFAPLAVVPALWRQRGLGPAALAVGLPIVLYVPYAAAGGSLFGGLRTYADIWQFNAGLYAVLEILPGPHDAPKWIGGLVVGAVAVGAALRDWSLGRALFWTIGAALALSPTVHPWYLLWVLPFACRYRSRGWILYTGTVFLSYAGRTAYLETGVWPEPAWLSVLIHGPPLALLARDGWRGRTT